MPDERDEMHDEMHDEMRDEMIERVAARLRPLPDVDAAAKARVLVAVAAERERDRERARVVRRRQKGVRWGAVTALAAAMVVSVVLAGRDRLSPATSVSEASSGAATAVASPTAGAPATLAARDVDGGVALQPVQLVFRSPAARRVSVVGDFTGWDPDKAAMTRDSASGLWSVSLALPPGRHVYAFLVDDSVWVRDPRAPAAPDADFGRPGSVMLVGRP